MPPEALPAVLHDLVAPWRDELVRRSLIEMTLLGVPAGLLGCWIVLYEMSYGAESLAHGMFPGLVVAALAGIPLVLGGAVGVLVAALGIWLAGRISGIERDTAIAVSVSALFGLGVLLALSRNPRRESRACCSATSWGSPTATYCSRPASVRWWSASDGCCTLGCWPSASTAPGPAAWVSRPRPWRRRS